MRFLHLFFLSLLTLSFVNCNASSSEWKEDKNSQVRIIHTSEGFTIQVGLNPGCKTYYKDAGDIGYPTDFKITNTHNIKNIKIKWPKPSKVKFNGLVSYIYTNEVLFPIHIERKDESKKASFDLEFTYAVCQVSCEKITHHYKIKTTTNQQHQFEVTDKYIEKIPTFLYFIIIAFIGGLILNVMPCVLPIITLKIYSIAKSSNSSYARLNLFSTLCGIMTSFLIVALMTVFFRELGDFAGIGFYFQNPQFLIFLILVLVLFGLSLLGSYKLQLPGFFNKLSDNSQKTSSMLSSFSNGLLITAFALPCSAPFVGVAISFALAASSFEIFAIFITMALGLGFPYILLLLSPKLINFLPKPGKWVMIFEKLVAIFLFLTVFWLIYVLYNQIGIWPAVILFGICLLLKFVLEESSFFSRHLIIKKVGIICLIVLAFLLPNIEYKIDAQKQQKIDSTWMQLNISSIPSLVASGKVVIVDVTAEWCGTCKFNKIMTFDTVKGLSILNKQNVIAMRGDVTKENSPEILKYIKSFNRHGIPLNVVYGPNAPQGILLSEVVWFSDLQKAYQKAK